MDIKIEGLSRDIMHKALVQAREGRLHILAEMDKTIKTNRTEVSPYAPRFTTLQISTERIKDLIGPGGKNIKAISTVLGRTIAISKENGFKNADRATIAVMAMDTLDVIALCKVVYEQNMEYVLKNGGIGLTLTQRAARN